MANLRTQRPLPDGLFSHLGISSGRDQYRPELLEFVLPVISLYGEDEPSEAHFTRHASRAAGGAGTFANVQLWNPGPKVIRLRSLHHWIAGASNVLLYHAVVELVTAVGAGFATDLGAAPAVGRVATAIPAATVGTLISTWAGTTSANGAKELETARGIIIRPANGLTVAHSAANTGLDGVVFRWDEEDEI